MDVIFGNLDLWGQAISNTLIVFFAGGIIALILGLIVGAMRVSPVPIARGVGTAYAVGILLVLRTASLSAESDEPPMLLELGLVPRALSLVATILVSFVGVTATVQHILLEPHDEVDVALDAIGIWAMILAWVLFHWGFAQLYLQLYYRETDPPLRFPSAAAPGILEFAYFAYTLAVSLAVSDVDVLDRRMRWRVLVHSVLSFFFNGLIIVTALGAISEIGNGVL